MERNKISSPKGASPKRTPEASSGRSQSAPSSHESPDHPTQEPKIWTLTNTPRSAPLMAAPKLEDSPRTEVWTSKEIPESRSLDSLFPTRSLSDSLTSASLISRASETEMCDSDLETLTRLSAPTCDLTDNTVLSPSPLTTEARPGPSTLSEETTAESSVSPHPSKPSVSLLSTASDESGSCISMASDSASSTTESCKTPVAVRNGVVIAMDYNDRKIIHPSEKTEGEMLNVVKNVCKGSSKEEAVITMGLDGEKESSVKSESESSTEEVINKSQETEMKDTTTGDAIIDIMGSDNDNEETSAINEKSNDGKSLLLDQHVTYFSLFKFVCLKIIQPSNLSRTTDSAEREGMVFLQPLLFPPPSWVMQ